MPSLTHLASDLTPIVTSLQPLYHRCFEWQYWCYEEHVGRTDRLYEHGPGVRFVTHSLVSGYDAWVSRTRCLPHAFQPTPHSPVIGGTLARPQDNFPRLFSSPFWGEFPYFLPCGVTASFSLLTFGAILFLLKEVGAPPMLILWFTTDNYQDSAPWRHTREKRSFH